MQPHPALSCGLLLACALPCQSEFEYYHINQVLATGQSLATGVGGTTVLSVTQPFTNLMFDTGICTGVGTGFVPLVNTQRETMYPSFANLVTQLASTEVFIGLPAPIHSHDILVTCHAVGGLNYRKLKKGSNAYQTGMNQVTQARNLALGLGLTHTVRAVTNIHGETDHQTGNTHYQMNLVQWQEDYETDVRAITGQETPVPMLHSQMSSWTWYGQATSLIPIDQLNASKQVPDKLLLVGPKYFLPYADGVHLTSEGYQQLGEYYAKVYDWAVLRQRRWKPLWPVSAQASGSKIIVTFEVPDPPLVLDTTLVSDPGNYGFEYFEPSPSRPVTSTAPIPTLLGVAITGPVTVELTLSGPPAGNKPVVRYAYSGRPAAPAGPMTGPRGNLRDSDPTPSRHGYPLYNWAVHFEIPVTN